MVSDIIKKIDEVDASIRAELKLLSIPLGERGALEEARDLIQKALTPLLKYRLS